MKACKVGYGIAFGFGADLDGGEHVACGRLTAGGEGGAAVLNVVGIEKAADAGRLYAKAVERFGGANVINRMGADISQGRRADEILVQSGIEMGVNGHSLLDGAGRLRFAAVRAAAAIHAQKRISGTRFGAVASMLRRGAVRKDPDSRQIAFMAMYAQAAGYTDERGWSWEMARAGKYSRDGWANCHCGRTDSDGEPLSTLDDGCGLMPRDWLPMIE